MPACGVAPAQPARRRPQLHACAVVAAWAAACSWAGGRLLRSGFVLAPTWRRPRRVPAASGRNLVAAGAFQFPFAGLFDDSDTAVGVPGNNEEVLNGLKSSTENALNRGISRLDVELPAAFLLGVEGDKKGVRLLSDKLAESDQAKVDTADREVARTFVEMLQPIAQGLCVIFRNQRLADKAQEVWKLADEEGSILAFPRKPKGAFSEEVMEGEKFNEMIAGAGCQCLVVVAPRLRQLRLIKGLGDVMEDQMGIILLNARISGKGREAEKIPQKFRKALLANYEATYHLRFVERKNALIFGKMGKDGKRRWALAQQREVLGGRTMTDEVKQMDEEPSPGEVRKALAEYDAREKDLGSALIDIVDKDKMR